MPKLYRKELIIYLTTGYQILLQGKRKSKSPKHTRENQFLRHTIKGLTCKDFATKSESGLKTNDALSPHGVFVT